MTTDSSCEYLEWDSSFFGKRIGRVSSSRVNADAMDRILSWAESNDIDGLYFLVDINCNETIAAAEQARFHLTDIRVVMGIPLDRIDDNAPDSSAGFRMAQTDDISGLKEIAGTAFTPSRFYHDGHFARSDCDRLYETWIENSVRGFAQAVIVSTDANDRPTGFISCHVNNECGSIGLVAVSETARGKGLGYKLAKNACLWLKEQGCSDITVPTQARNIPAYRMYERCGFETRSMSLWYHKWFNT